MAYLCSNSRGEADGGRRHWLKREKGEKQGREMKGEEGEGGANDAGDDGLRQC